MDNSGQVILIATIPQGASVNQRIGKRIVLRSLLMRGLSLAGTTGTVADGGFLIVYDMKPTGAIPAISDILVSPLNSFMNDNNTSRFRVLRRVDNVYIGNQLTPTTGGEAYNIDEYLKINRPMIFESAGTGAIGDIDTGALYLVTYGNRPAGSAAPQLGLAFRTRFTEM